MGTGVCYHIYVTYCQNFIGYYPRGCISDHVYLHEENMLDDVVDPRIQRLVNSATRIISVPTENNGAKGSIRAMVIILDDNSEIRAHV